DPAYVGTWKVQVTQPGQTVTVWLVKIEGKAGKPEASILSTGLPNFKDAKLTDLKRDDQTLQLTMKANGIDFAFTIMLSKGEEKAKKLLGSVSIRGQAEFARLERTDQEKLDDDPRKNMETDKSAADLPKAVRMTDVKEKEAALKDLEAKTEGTTLGYVAGLFRLGLMAKEGAAEADVKAQADKVVAFASDYGP